MARLAAPLFLLLALAGCARPVDFAGGQGARDAREDACRQEATRVVQWQDRGQLMRADEAENRRDGNASVTPPSRAESDRLGQQVARDRLAAECVRGAPR